MLLSWNTTITFLNKLARAMVLGAILSLLVLNSFGFRLLADPMAYAVAVYIAFTLAIYCLFHTGEAIRLIQDQNSEIKMYGMVMQNMRASLLMLIHDHVLTRIQEYFRDGTTVNEYFVEVYPDAIYIIVGRNGVFVSVDYNDLRQDWQKTLAKAKEDFLAKQREQA